MLPWLPSEGYMAQYLVIVAASLQPSLAHPGPAYSHGQGSGKVKVLILLIVPSGSG